MLVGGATGIVYNRSYNLSMVRFCRVIINIKGVISNRRQRLQAFDVCVF